MYKFSKLLLTGLCCFLSIDCYASTADQDKAMASRLFSIDYSKIDDANLGANYTYNKWKASPKMHKPGECDAYDGGHSGIDIQTKDVAGKLTADRVFNAITKGKVIKAGGDNFNTIAIYDQQKDITSIYLHARQVDVSIGDDINLGQTLGVQGDAGVSGNEHVHFEVRKGRHSSYACGGSDLTSLNPIKIASEYVNGRSEPVGNKPRYVVIVKDKPITWQQARDEATALGGHLATITSATEQQAVWDVVRKVPESWVQNTSGFYLGPWLGGFQVPGVKEPNEGWRWVTGEPFSYKAWDKSQPNNAGTNNGLTFMGHRERSPDWGDYPINPRGTGRLPKISAFVVERAAVKSLDQESFDLDQESFDRSTTADESDQYSKVLADRATVLCSSLTVKCKEVIVNTTEAWLKETLQQSVGNLNARRKFEMLFSNPGAIATDAERLALLEEVLNDGEMSKQLRTKLSSEFITRKDIGLPKLDAEAVQNIAFDVALDIITNLAINSLAEDKERSGDQNAAYWIRTAAKPSIDIATLANGLAAGTVSVTAASLSAGVIWAKNIYSFVQLGARLNADKAAGRDIDSQLKMLEEQNLSIIESLRSGETRGIIFKEVNPPRNITQKERGILEDQLVLNNTHQTELLKSQAVLKEFDWVVKGAISLASKLGLGESIPNYSGLEHANSTPSLPGDIEAQSPDQAELKPYLPQKVTVPECGVGWAKVDIPPGWTITMGWNEAAATYKWRDVQTGAWIDTPGGGVDSVKFCAKHKGYIGDDMLLTWSKIGVTQTQSPDHSEGQLSKKIDRSKNWSEDPRIKKIIREIMTSNTPRQVGKCKQAFGPLNSHQMQKLFSGTLLELKYDKYPFSENTLSSYDGKMCLKSPIQCGHVSYCGSSEAIFMISSNSVKAVTYIDTSSITDKTIKDYYHPNSNEVLITDPIKNCMLKTNLTEPTSINWTGSCTNGYLSGEGVLTFNVGLDPIWRISIGSEWGTVLRDGRLAYDLDFKDFEYKLMSCQSYIGYRMIDVIVPSYIKAETFFENRWIAEQVTKQALEFAILTCPKSHNIGNYSNISLNIQYWIGNDKLASVIRGSSSREQTLSRALKEYNFVAVNKLDAFFAKQKKERIAKERQHAVQAQAVAAQQQLDAEINGIKKRIERFFDDGVGTPEEIATALQIDEQRTLERLEQGLQLDVQPVKGVKTIKREGKTYYSVKYRSRSLIRAVIEKHRLNRMKSNFSWNDWFDQTSSYGKDRALNLICLYDSVSDIPKQQTRVKTNLMSFNSSGNGYNNDMSIILECGKRGWWD